MYSSRTDPEVGADLLRVEVLVDNALDDARAVVVEEAWASLAKARNQLVKTLKKKIITDISPRLYQRIYQTNLIEEVHDLLFCGLVSDELVLKAGSVFHEDVVLPTNVSDDVHTNVAGQLVPRGPASETAGKQGEDNQSEKFHHVRSVSSTEDWDFPLSLLSLSQQKVSCRTFLMNSHKQ